MKTPVKNKPSDPEAFPLEAKIRWFDLMWKWYGPNMKWTTKGKTSKGMIKKVIGVGKMPNC